jgi:pimeloyl-ACP methyl ester carboxylesterase
MGEADERDLLPRIAVPTLLMWGELDVRSPLSVALQFEQAIPDTTFVVIPGSGHVSNLDHPEQFNGPCASSAASIRPGRALEPPNDC